MVKLHNYSLRGDALKISANNTVSLQFNSDESQQRISRINKEDKATFLTFAGVDVFNWKGSNWIG